MQNPVDDLPEAKRALPSRSNSMVALFPPSCFQSWCRVCVARSFVC